jgi:hypothetical protein
MKNTFLLALVLALLAACTPTSADFLLPVNDFLVQNVGQRYFGGKVFCAYDVLGTGPRDDGVDVYVWALCGEYTLDNSVLTLGTASSLPVALHMQKSNGQYTVTSYEVPRDGIDYGSSIQRIFPPAAIEKMCETNADCYNERAQRLQNEIEQKAGEVYGFHLKFFPN